jgi:hypothetical protein
LELIRAAATIIFFRHTADPTDRTLFAHEAVTVLKLLEEGRSDGVDASIVIKELLDLLLI